MRIFNLVLFLILIIRLGDCHSQDSHTNLIDLLDISELWQSDTCGMADDRVLIAPIIVKHKRSFIGLDVKSVVSIFGEADRVTQWRDGNNARYYYSTSSISGTKGNCGEPATSSFSIIVDIESNLVIDLLISIH